MCYVSRETCLRDYDIWRSIQNAIMNESVKNDNGWYIYDWVNSGVIRGSNMQVPWNNKMYLIYMDKWLSIFPI